MTLCGVASRHVGEIALCCVASRPVGELDLCGVTSLLCRVGARHSQVTVVSTKTLLPGLGLIPAH